MFSEPELAFAENLILQGGVPAPRILYLLRVKEADPQRMLWELAAQLQVATPPVLNRAYTTATAALDLLSPAAFSFSEGAMIGPWELVARRGEFVGAQLWIGRRQGLTAALRLVPPGSGRGDPARGERFVERSNVGLEPPHPSVLRIDEAGEDFGWLFTASFGFEGSTLASIREQGPLSEASALGLAQSLAGTLSVVHELGVVHGGLNPLAILVKESRTHLSDFGVSSAVLDGPHAGNRPGCRLPILLFAAPALVAGNAARGLDARDDLYALGGLVYYAVCAVQPGAQRASPDAPWLVEPPVSQGLRAVLLRLLAPHQDARYGSARELLADLARVAQGGLPGPLAPAGEAVRGRRSPVAAPQRPVTPQDLGGDAVEEEDEAVAVTEVDAAEVDEAEAEAEAEEDERPRAPVKRGASGRLGRASSGRLAAGRASSGRLAAKRPVSSRRSRLPSGAGAIPQKKSAGWGLLFASLLLVGGGLTGAVLLTQAQGAALTRTRLDEAFLRLEREAPPYAEAVAELDQVLRGSLDPALARDAIALREALLRRAAAEREALVAAVGSGAEAGAGEGAPPVAAQAPALQALRDRVRGLRLEALVRYDQLRGEADVTDAVWGTAGKALLQAGYPREALDALTRGKRGKPELDWAAFLAQGAAFLPGGPALAPTTDARSGERVLGVVWREPAYLGRTEVTRGAYRRFLAALAQTDEPHARCVGAEPEGKDHAPEGWSAEPGADDAEPATGLDYYDAFAYAAWLGGSLPGVETLRFAAQGPLVRPYPWGQLPPGLAFTNAGEALGGPAPAGSFPGGAGVGGARDLLGNVEEWAAVPLEGGASDQAPVFGGHFATPASELKPEAREVDRLERSPRRGFRVLLPAPE